MFNLRIRRTLAVLIAVGAVGLTSYAFLGSIGGLGTAGRAGAATQTLSGYTVSNINYTYNGGDPNKIDVVTFTLDGPAAMVKTRLVAAGPYYGCVVNTVATATTQSVAGQSTWTVFMCDTTAPQATVTAQDQLSIVAHS